MLDAVKSVCFRKFRKFAIRWAQEFWRRKAIEDHLTHKDSHGDTAWDQAGHSSRLDYALELMSSHTHHRRAVAQSQSTAQGQEILSQTKPVSI